MCCVLCEICYFFRNHSAGFYLYFTALNTAPVRKVGAANRSGFIQVYSVSSDPVFNTISQVLTASP